MDLLAQAGYSKGFSTKITFMTNPTNQTVYTAIQGYLKDVGIVATLDPADMGRQTQTITQGWNNSMVLNLMANSPEFWFTLGSTLRDRFSSKGSQYVSVQFPDEYQTKLAQTLAELDPQKRQAGFQDLMKLITDTYCINMPYMVSYGLLAMSSKVHDLDIYQYSGDRWVPANVWLSK